MLFWGEDFGEIRFLQTKAVAENRSNEAAFPLSNNPLRPLRSPREASPSETGEARLVPDGLFGRTLAWVCPGAESLTRELPGRLRGVETTLDPAAAIPWGA